MERRAVRIIFLSAAVLLVLGIFGCGHDQELTSITVTPSNTTLDQRKIQFRLLIE